MSKTMWESGHANKRNSCSGTEYIYEDQSVFDMCPARHRLHSFHGNKWSVIGKSMGMSGRAVIDKYRSMSKRETKG